MIARTQSDERQATFGFLVRDVGEGEGFEAGLLRGVVQRFDRGGPRTGIELRLEVAGLASPLFLDLRADDLSVAYGDEVLGIALRGQSSAKMRIRAPRERKIRRIGGNPTPTFPILAE